ncbi:antibiotic biosynthesis monooxygenase [Kitasatospora sp. MAP5-34]|uniref:antibiotic biosynthesis monooxygenase family protein n=1 Tax=Kitasatospora sp. MAP5-34 TaxID=3035102 RepID=UPI00247585B0|nr:antibiotic biosynthesis monooxygenase [Kitasatospora sp. MAP5-34]MDH6575233.1 quinol monooxygenase YgiN [Kitasatospora sp. MAP5-34]
MSGQVLSEVSAVVAAERQAELVTSYRELVAGPLPDGLIRTELLRGPGGRWRVQSLWRDRAALEAVRADPKLTAAPRLFRDVGAEPELTVFQVTAAQVGALALG